MKPLPIKICMWILLVGGAGGLLGLAITPLDLHIYSVGEETMGGLEFLAKAGTPFGIASLVFLATSIGLFRDLRWTRLAILGSILAYGGSAAFVGVRLNEFALWTNAGVGSILVLIPAAAYLYLNKRATAYYARLKEHAADGA
jgi:hypothetical protein